MSRWELGDGAWVELHEGFAPDHETSMRTLRAELPLRPQRLILFGREVETPRLCSWHGDPGASYGYSGRRFAPLPWTECLGELRDRVSKRAGVRFNGVLANLYRDGGDSMGAHADDEPELGPADDDVRIATLSLGAPRRFVLRQGSSGERREWQLGEGSLFLMGGTLQRRWQHSIPKTRRAVGPRMSLTFRCVRL